MQKRGKFRAKFVGPYKILAFDEERRRCQLKPTHADAEQIDFMVPTFNLVHYNLQSDLTYIKMAERDIDYVPRKTSRLRFLCGGVVLHM